MLSRARQAPATFHVHVVANLAAPELQIDDDRKFLIFFSSMFQSLNLVTIITTMTMITTFHDTLARAQHGSNSVVKDLKSKDRSKDLFLTSILGSAEDFNLGLEQLTAKNWES